MIERASGVFIKILSIHLMDRRMDKPFLKILFKLDGWAIFSYTYFCTPIFSYMYQKMSKIISLDSSHCEDWGIGLIFPRFGLKASGSSLTRFWSIQRIKSVFLLLLFLCNTSLTSSRSSWGSMRSPPVSVGCQILVFGWSTHEVSSVSLQLFRKCTDFHIQIGDSRFGRKHHMGAYLGCTVIVS